MRDRRTSTYGAATYGDRIAEIYDELHPFADQTDAAVELLAELAQQSGAGPSGGGRVLELGIGTGRIALPLAGRGFAVSGIDASEAMLTKLRAKPGSEVIELVVGDFVDVPGDTMCNLVFVAFNTFFGLLTQEDQVRCFAGVARRLAPEGRFLIEAFVPDVTRFDRQQRTSSSAISDDTVMLEVSDHDPVSQHVTSAHVVLTEAGTRIYPIQIRYAWPGELDLMARLAGLELEHRWGDWKRSPFTAASGGHVSVWRRP